VDVKRMLKSRSILEEKPTEYDKKPRFYDVSGLLRAEHEVVFLTFQLALRCFR